MLHFASNDNLVEDDQESSLVHKPKPRPRYDGSCWRCLESSSECLGYNRCPTWDPDHAPEEPEDGRFTTNAQEESQEESFPTWDDPSPPWGKEFDIQQKPQEAQKNKSPTSRTHLQQNEGRTIDQKHRQAKRDKVLTSPSLKWYEDGKYGVQRPQHSNKNKSSSSSTVHKFLADPVDFKRQNSLPHEASNDIFASNRLSHSRDRDDDIQTDASLSPTHGVEEGDTSSETSSPSRRSEKDMSAPEMHQAESGLSSRIPLLRIGKEANFRKKNGVETNVHLIIRPSRHDMLLWVDGNRTLLPTITLPDSSPYHIPPSGSDYDFTPSFVETIRAACQSRFKLETQLESRPLALFRWITHFGKCMTTAFGYCMKATIQSSALPNAGIPRWNKGDGDLKLTRMAPTGRGRLVTVSTTDAQYLLNRHKWMGNSTGLKDWSVNRTRDEFFVRASLEENFPDQEYPSAKDARNQIPGQYYSESEDEEDS